MIKVNVTLVSVSGTPIRTQTFYMTVDDGGTIDINVPVTVHFRLGDMPPIIVGQIEQVGDVTVETISENSGLLENRGLLP